MIKCSPVPRQARAAPISVGKRKKERFFSLSQTPLSLTLNKHNFLNWPIRRQIASYRAGQPGIAGLVELQARTNSGVP